MVRVDNINSSLKTWSVDYWGIVSRAGVAYAFGDDISDAIASQYFSNIWGRLLANKVDATDGLTYDQGDPGVTNLDITEYNVISTGLSGLYEYSKKGGSIEKAAYGSAKYLGSQLIGRQINKQIWTMGVGESN